MNIIVNQLEFVSADRHNLWTNYLTGATLEQLGISSWKLSIELDKQSGKKEEYIQVGETPDIAYDLLVILLKNDFDDFDEFSKDKAIVFEKRGVYSFNVHIDVEDSDLIKAISKLLFGLHEAGANGIFLHRIVSVTDISKNTEISDVAFENAYAIATGILDEFLEQEQDNDDVKNNLFTNLNTNYKFNIN